MPDVVEAYRDFSPPCDVRATVEDLLSTVPTDHLAGLTTVVLTNAGALGRRRRRAWSWSRGRKAPHTRVRGLYHGGREGQPTCIELFVDNIIGGTPRTVLRFRLARTLLFGPVLFHEFGHHIHARFRPEHREREDVADEWARKLMRAHSRRRHAVARIALRPLVWLSRRRG